MRESAYSSLPCEPMPWGTCTGRDYKDSGENTNYAKGEKKKRMPCQVVMCALRIGQCQDSECHVEGCLLRGNGTGSHPELWPTTTEGDSRSSGSRNTPDSKAHPGTSLTDAVRGDEGKGRVKPELFASPTSSTGGADKASNRSARVSGGAKLVEQVGAALNPRWEEALMGLKLGWLRPSATVESTR